MDDIKQRLRETSDTCFTCYEAWSGGKKDSKLREALIESIHEMRKVASRLEIELAISERDELTQKPIPIPPHRDAKRKAKDADEVDGNSAAPPPKSSGAKKSGGARRKPVKKGDQPSA